MRWGSPHAVLTSLLGVEGAHFFGALLQDFFIDKHSPGGMIGGIITLGAIGLISEALSEFGFSAVFSGVVKQLYKQGETKSSIQEKVKKYPISKSLKRKLNEELDRL